MWLNTNKKASFLHNVAYGLTSQTSLDLSPHESYIERYSKNKKTPTPILPNPFMHMMRYSK